MPEMINDLFELADHVTYGFDRKLDDAQRAEKMIAKSLFKYTRCGISFWVPGTDSVGVAGYCEGSDREHLAYIFKYPFTADEFDTAVISADTDGCDTWDATHGCEKCNPDGTCDEYGNEFAPGEVGGPVNPSCPECKGYGVVL